MYSISTHTLKNKRKKEAFAHNQNFIEKFTPK